MTEEWTPWVEHDGKGCPCVGRYVHVICLDGDEWFGIAASDCYANGIDPQGDGSGWVWHPSPDYDHVAKYRIRKPKALTMLQNIARDVDALVDA